MNISPMNPYDGLMTMNISAILWDETAEVFAFFSAGPHLFMCPRQFFCFHTCRCIMYAQHSSASIVSYHQRDRCPLFEIPRWIGSFFVLQLLFLSQAIPHLSFRH